MRGRAGGRSRRGGCRPWRGGGGGGGRRGGMGLDGGGGVMVLAGGTSHGRLNHLFGAGIGAVLVLLVTEHIVVAMSARRGLAGLSVAFFTLNGVVSCVLGVL